MPKHLDEVLVVIGGVLVAVGVGLYSLPAGVIVAGAEMIALGFVIGKANANEPN